MANKKRRTAHEKYVQMGHNKKMGGGGGRGETPNKGTVVSSKQGHKSGLLAQWYRLETWSTQLDTMLGF